MKRGGPIPTPVKLELASQTVSEMEKLRELKHLIERFFVTRRRIVHWGASRAKNKALTEATLTVTKVLRNARESNARRIGAVLNVGLFLLHLDQDLTDFRDDISHAIGDRRRRFFAKQLAVLLYEASEDLPQLLGKDFRRAVDFLRPPQDVVDELKVVSSELNAFWIKHREFLKTIRNAVAAHREHDALTYLDVLGTVEPLNVMQRAAEISGPLDRLVGVIRQIMETSVSNAAILRDIVDGIDGRSS